MAKSKRVRMMDKVMQVVHNQGTMVSACAHIKQVYAVKGTIIGSLVHQGAKRRVKQQSLGVWQVVS